MNPKMTVKQRDWKSKTECVSMLSRPRLDLTSLAHLHRNLKLFSPANDHDFDRAVRFCAPNTQDKFVHSSNRYPVKFDNDVTFTNPRERRRTTGVEPFELVLL